MSRSCASSSRAGVKGLSRSQQRFVDSIPDSGAEYWQLVNDWLKGLDGPAKSLAFRNQGRTIDALVRANAIRIDDDGLVWKVAPAVGENHGG